jgi:triacylglycerol esterase/lipase EstA (alpha/beta hydrolase family)
VLVLAAVVALALVVVLVVLVTSRSEHHASVAQSRPGPVIVLPGYGGDTESLTPLLAELRSEGREAVLFEPTDNEQGDLRVQAKRLTTLAEDTAAHSDVGSVDVIGYSAGGVIARLFVRDYDGARVVRRVLTLGSPHHGAEVAASAGDLAGGCPKACEQLAVDSDLLRHLNAGDETPAGPTWATIRSSSDQTVTPIDSAELDGALNLRIQDLCPGSTTSHGALPGDPVVRSALRSVLGTGTMTAPTKVSC